MGREVGGRASGLRGGAEVLGKGVSLCVGERRSSAGMGCAVGGECIAQPAGVRRRCVGDQKCSGRACRCAGGVSEDLRRGMGGEGGEECIVAGRGSGSVRGGSGSARGGRVAVRGRAEIFSGEWVVRAAGLTHIRRSSTRARVLLYIRPPCPRREIAAMGPKDAPCEYPSPAKAFAPAPSAFTLPPSAFTLSPHGLPRSPRSNRPPAAAVIHNGLSTEKLSTSLPAALCKTFSPSRLRTRIYNISFALASLPGSVRAAPEKSPRRCGIVSRAAERRVGEGEGKGGRPLAQCRTMPLVCRITVCKGGSAQGKPRPCPCVLPATACLSPRPRPLVCRITVRKGGSAQGQPRPCPCVFPAATCLRPRPRPLMGEAPCAEWGRAKAKADAPSHSNPPLSVYRRAPAA